MKRQRDRRRHWRLTWYYTDSTPEHELYHFRWVAELVAWFSEFMNPFAVTTVTWFERSKK